MEYTKAEAIERLLRNGAKIEEYPDGGGRIIHKGPGLKLLSAIDYLVNKHKFFWGKGDK